MAEIKQPLIDATAELLRVMVLAVIPLLIASLENQSIDWRVIGIVALIAGLRWLDKFLHKFGEANNRTTLEGGLTRF
jgi:hypothetical protein